MFNLRKTVLLAWVALAAPVLAQTGDKTPMKGMDEAVNINLAQQAGHENAGKPLLDTESLGDLWNLLLLLGGAVPGFIVGRYWDHLFGKRDKQP
ncbi:MAG: hypothetical protein LBF16_10270 [Pseudomonadales bacterium]|jgi:hypothetical protein|nr:hypothetical protein [Pseudomonadales bacterium]